ncbi:uncharacterized protein UTRI_06086 [Ustilago trichophora]|uniref:CCHC-type domain-containing protein n=1 Tax=Ustilago trichophora TaxID=86804 RepID=A0A5C3EHD2_9BASI|nr:uncharacterized protein UTRI_06086 [Ustilago trichophora]
MASGTERDADGRIVQNDPPHAAGRDRRGVLLTPAPPLVDWSILTYSLASIHGAVNPNVVRYQLPFHLCKSQYEEVQLELSNAFTSSFPSKDPANIRIVKATGSGARFKYIDIETPQSNVSGDEIVSAASEQRWTERIPHGYIGKFLSDLPNLLKIIEPSTTLKVHDIWKVEYKQPFHSSNQSPSQCWSFGSSIVVLLSFDSLPIGEKRIADVVYRWPGWIRWEEEELVLGLCFPGRYDYCGFCKYTAQILEGSDGERNGGNTRRHKLSMCRKLICTKCGRTGHYDTTCKSAKGA